MSFFFKSTALWIPLLVIPLFAGPKIEFDTKSFNCGTVVEGKVEKINAAFNVKNTGNAPLRITNVKPGCGCTVVKFDTLIQPGKSAKIEADVNIKGYRSGSISKWINVSSNSEADSSVRLTIEATIQSIMDVSEGYLNLDTSMITKAKEITLSTKKADLKISSVTFKVPEDTSFKPITVKTSFGNGDSTRADGYKVYKLGIFAPAIAKTTNGEFVIKTNHPDKAELSIRATITK